MGGRGETGGVAGVDGDGALRGVGLCSRVSHCAAFLMMLIVDAAFGSGTSVPLHHLRSGRATVHYFHASGVVLELRRNSGSSMMVPLTSAQTGQQRRPGLFYAVVIAKDVGHLVIFTDSFASNANIQGECGASDGKGGASDGERFLHVVSLGETVREMLSLNIDSCDIAVEAISGYPKHDSVSHTLFVKLQRDETGEISERKFRVIGDVVAEILQQGEITMTNRREIWSTGCASSLAALGNCMAVRFVYEDYLDGSLPQMTSPLALRFSKI